MEPGQVVSVIYLHKNDKECNQLQASSSLNLKQPFQKLLQVCVSNLHDEIDNSQLFQRRVLEQSQFNKDQLIYHDSVKLEQNQEENIQSLEQKIKTPINNGRLQKFKRSTNNSHKKFISVARRWMFKNNCFQLKAAFQNKFACLKSTRTYFFIILAFIKSAMSQEKQKFFIAHFRKEIQSKINIYEREIQVTINQNLKHFRGDEITDLKFSIKAFNLFFQGDIEKSIQCIYKKDKMAIVKKQHYQEALKTVISVECYFRGQNSVLQMIKMFGTSKKRNIKERQKSAAPFLSKNFEDKMKRKGEFFFPQMFGLNCGFIFDNMSFKKILLKSHLKTSQCDQIKSQLCSQNSKNNDFDHSDGNFQNSKMPNFVFNEVPNKQIRECFPRNKINQNLHMFGFRPFQNF